MPGGGQACFAVRVRDLVGRVSSWSSWRSTAVPFDDRASTRSSGGSTLVSRAEALGGTLTRLTATGTLRLPNAVARHVGVCLLADPSQGSVDVLVGGVRVAHVYLAAASWQRRVVVLPVRTGTVVLRAATGAALIDGVVLLRN